MPSCGGYGWAGGYGMGWGWGPWWGYPWGYPPPLALGWNTLPSLYDDPIERYSDTNDLVEDENYSFD